MSGSAWRRSTPGDLRFISLAMGIAAGAVIVRQRFETEGSAPDRTSAAPTLALVTNATVGLHARTFLRLDTRGATELARVQTAIDAEPELDQQT